MISGFLSDDPQELHAYAQQLLADQELAVHMGYQARKVVLERFPLSKFRSGMFRAIETARRKWQRCIAPSLDIEKNGIGTTLPMNMSSVSCV